MFVIHHLERKQIHLMQNSRLYFYSLIHSPSFISPQEEGDSNQERGYRDESQGDQNPQDRLPIKTHHLSGAAPTEILLAPMMTLTIAHSDSYIIKDQIGFDYGKVATS
ncbi:uncharacterized protein L3040_000986 [Drepanopeziza brunnea f. sp. 'multigermtubi']|uniref:uncharacterized protein n=1 Tax=Drepanopeziza brunnea f. sp. 'multigermtubi' TaxID=698441 RepID=UPI0023897B87|nr:hypothetical protein L3040_000986 [Drepanopeziza brunnea f. sp. 'multigermtubi']